MENLIFSLNATVPVFLMMLLGVAFRKAGWVDDVFASKMNRFVFQVSLPVLVFADLAEVELSEAWDAKFVLFCFAVTVISIGVSVLISYIWKDKSLQGEFIQASYRSSAALLGIAFIQNIYGTSGMAPMMILGSVPLYNMMAVVILSFFQPERRKMDRELLKRTGWNILKNPIILGIAAGLLWSALEIPMPHAAGQTLSNLAATAAPMGLIAMGASFDIRKALSTGKEASAAAFIKLVGFCAVFLPAAVWLGFRQEELVAILVMLGSATTVSCYVMAKNMGHEGTLTSGTVMLTTLLSGFTLTAWLYILRSFSWI